MSAPRSRFEVEWDGGCVRLMGELDVCAAGRIDTAIDARRTEEVDLSGITFIDCAGAHALETLARRGQPRFVRASAPVQRLVELIGRRDLLD
jgi:anti-anti-sigma regulatory factor